MKASVRAHSGIDRGGDGINRGGNGLEEGVTSKHVAAVLIILLEVVVAVYLYSTSLWWRWWWLILVVVVVVAAYLAWRWLKRRRARPAQDGDRPRGLPPASEAWSGGSFVGAKVENS